MGGVNKKKAGKNKGGKGGEKPKRSTPPHKEVHWLSLTNVNRGFKWPVPELPMIFHYDGCSLDAISTWGKVPRHVANNDYATRQLLQRSRLVRFSTAESHTFPRPCH